MVDKYGQCKICLASIKIPSITRLVVKRQANFLRSLVFGNVLIKISTCLVLVPVRNFSRVYDMGGGVQRDVRLVQLGAKTISNFLYYTVRGVDPLNYCSWKKGVEFL